MLGRDDIVPAIPAVLDALVPRVVPLASWTDGGLTVAQALAYSVAASMSAWCWTVDGTPVFLFGVCPCSVLGDMAMAWCIPAVDIRKYVKQLCAGRMAVIEQLLTLYPLIHALEDGTSARNIRFLQWLGFTNKDELWTLQR